MPTASSYRVEKRKSDGKEKKKSKKKEETENKHLNGFAIVRQIKRFAPL
jgi:hypothetical protein